MADFFSNAFELGKEWKATGRTEKLNDDQLKTVKDCYVKCHQLEDGTVIRNVVFVLQNGRPKSCKMAPEKYQTPYPEGTKIDPKSCENREFIDEDTHPGAQYALNNAGN